MQHSANARVWIFQSNRPFTAIEEAAITSSFNEFITSWNAHGKALAGAFEIRYNRFIILIADESVTKASGCSIDKSSDLIRAIEQKYTISLFNRFNMAYKQHEEVISCTREEFEKLIEAGEIHEDTIVFNNMVNTVDQLSTKWEVPFKDSWHASIFA